jgi:hypothetical protein
MCSVLDLAGTYLSDVEGFTDMVSEEQTNFSACRIGVRNIKRTVAISNETISIHVSLVLKAACTSWA